MKRETYVGKIEEFRPQPEYDFEKYLLIGSLLGKGYAFNSGLRESLERANNGLLKLQPAYLRVPVNRDIMDSTKEKLIIPVSPIRGNLISRKWATTDSRDKIIQKDTEDGIMVGVGVRGWVIVKTGDAVLVCKKDRASQIKRLLENREEEYL